MKILIADDEPVSLRRLEKTLGGWGYEVLAARDGLEAWQFLVQPDAPKLAILDWVMPGMDGVDICRRERQLSRERYTYILLLTSRTSKADIVTGLQSGADDYLCKPVDHAELEFRLRAGCRIVNLQENLFDANRALKQQATHDQLTDLWNRRAIHEFLLHETSRANRENTPIGIVLADIDHFKLINDTYGHFVGDSVLRQVAERLKAELRDYDRIGRYGGEEFLIALPGCSAEAAVKQAERLRASIQQAPFAVAGAKLTVTISAGVAVDEAGMAADVNSLLQRSDLALYRAKHSGRNRIEFFTVETYSKLPEGLTLSAVASE
jgi:two-component system cell cycle response regulator